MQIYPDCCLTAELPLTMGTICDMSVMKHPPTSTTAHVAGANNMKKTHSLRLLY